MGDPWTGQRAPAPPLVGVCVVVAVVAAVVVGWVPLERPALGVIPWGAAPPVARTNTPPQVTTHDQPWGNPLGAVATVITQGYGVGTHAPAGAWGAVDLAVDGNGDGGADPDASNGTPIYATHDGVVTVTPNSVPAGNHVWVVDDEYRTGYSHLATFTVTSGVVVVRGTQIGTMGSTGQSSGPHLDYQVWQMVGGVWVNVDPNGYGVLEPLGG